MEDRMPNNFPVFIYHATILIFSIHWKKKSHRELIHSFDQFFFLLYAHSERASFVSFTIVIYIISGRSIIAV